MGDLGVGSTGQSQKSRRSGLPVGTGAPYAQGRECIHDTPHQDMHPHKEGREGEIEGEKRQKPRYIGVRVRDTKVVPL